MAVKATAHIVRRWTNKFHHNKKRGPEKEMRRAPTWVPATSLQTNKILGGGRK